ncbi:nitrate- and nitrite sensing domain-containing protein [Dactylosporangium siamense]|uniref:sensor histidine kinase n=1 Tax=Dactylosporangium siamense TaxID=685454 RepID=UPI00360BFEE5
MADAAPVRRRWRVTIADIPVAGKLALVLILPLAGLLGLAGVAASGYAAQSGRIGDLRAAVAAGAQAGLVTDGLQRERLALARLHGRDDARDAFATEAAGTDAAVARFRAAAAHVDGGAALARAVDGLDGLDLLRARASDTSGQLVLLGYRQLIADLVAFQQGIAERPAPPAVTAAIRAAGWLAEAGEELALVQLGTLRALAAGELTPADRDDVTAHRAAAAGAFERFTAAATPAWRAQLAGLSLDVERPAPAATDAAGLARTSLAQLDGLRVLADRVAADNAAAVTDARDRQNRTIILGLAAVLLVAAAAVWLAVAVGRSQRRGLRALLQAPAAELTAGGRDEVGRVTEAFNAVRREAARAAADQAALRTGMSGAYADLARRSARLADALLERLDDVERDEADPDRLATLFAADHLATLLRHDNHSLLVLAGAGTAREHAAPVPLLDVLRAAQSQIEAYQRVEYGRVDDAVAVEPAAVDGVVHLLAELLDNAARHSPADRPVVVEARHIGDGATIQVADRGPGVDPARLEELNGRLADPAPFGPRPGLTVVARLAARHGLDVTLVPSPHGGLVAAVRLPPALIVPALPVPVPGVPARPLPPRVLERSPALPGAEPMDIPHPRKDGGRRPAVRAGVAADGPTVEARAFDGDPPRRTVESGPAPGSAPGPAPGPAPVSAPVEPDDVSDLLSTYQHAIGRFDAVTVPVNQEGHATS